MDKIIIVISSLIAYPKLRTQVKHVWAPNPSEVINVCFFMLQSLRQFFCVVATYNDYSSAKHFFMRKVDSSTEIVGEESIL